MMALYISPDWSLTDGRAPSVRRLSGIRHRQSGQSLIELAFLVPLLLLLALGVI